jgi:uncharacterized protein with NRDE domain
MCVLAFAWQAHPRWKLVVAGNRDELHARSAAPLTRWIDRPALLGGRDLVSGGTWLGVSDAGRLAVVTNLRGYGAARPNCASRGALVTDMLSGEGRYANPTDDDLAEFNPFNLIVADAGGASFLTNRPQADRRALAPGIFGLSNGRFDEPWPKTMRLKSAMLDWIVSEAMPPRRLLEVLGEDRLPEAGIRSVEPSDAPREPAVSPIFIRDPMYGTRCSTVVAIDVDGAGVFIERRFAASGNPVGEITMSFTW